LCFSCSSRENSRLAAEVYKDMPENSFTRTISNPEVVMTRRRQQKLEKRMQEFRSSDGRPDSGRVPGLLDLPI
jgi:afadin